MESTLGDIPILALYLGNGEGINILDGQTITSGPSYSTTGRVETLGDHTLDIVAWQAQNICWLFFRVRAFILRICHKEESSWLLVGY